ncbi:glucose-1-phosphate adenylyltransferase subunit GlgD [Amygdalobacter nucleatus]|nr:glucose-1-phosphate adenylyltransferase subunit GlgD [Amygdalobacter nucleatus]MDF0486104.1 glucose-1-phosphate adenylyltransferase subunit GlgD [Amygdalobacter nucleatus]WEG37341.1 glucose-1-phosphate adenylyltransferase subunit GlgD [Amygdalobacter nucleatus]
MKSDACGLIFADGNGVELSDLTRLRSLAAVPFAGRYRIIDFALSDLVNSGVSKVGVVTNNKFKSLIDHVGTGSNWDLDHRNQGVFLLTPYVTSAYHPGMSDNLASIENFLRHNLTRDVILCGSSVVFNSNLLDVLRCHQETGADVTVMYDRHDNFPSRPYIVLETDENDKLLNAWNDPSSFVSNKLFLGCMIIKREVMLKLVEELISKGNGELTAQYLLHMSHNLDIRCYEYKGESLRINSVRDYYQATLSLLDREISRKLLDTEDILYTKVKDEAPTLYTDTARVTNSIVSDGCVIAGTVANSLIFRHVKIAKSATLKNCVIFQNVEIANDCYLENVILDKDCVIRSGIKMIGHDDYPVVIGKGAVV